MNQIVNINTAFSLTMSSVEIATLTNKRHDNVRADIEKIGRALSLTFQEKPVPSNGGRPVKALLLSKRETMILVSGYSIELRARIVDRWMELEEQVASSSGHVTASEAMLNKYVTETQEKIVAPLVQAIAELIRNQTPQAAPALTIAGWNLRSRRPQQQAGSRKPK